MNAFTIKDLENLSGIKAHTIRIWEQRYSFLKPSRTDTNIRYYNNDELRIILNVALLNKYGFKISHIDKMNMVEINDHILSLSQLQAQHERVINALIKNMVDLDIDEFDSVLEGYINARGIERTITQIIFPFLEKIGILWATNHINPAQEHLVTNIIRQKLIVGIDGCKTHIQANKTVLLFLPEGEHHELGLLFIYYLLKTRGLKVIYLGSNVPVKYVCFVIGAKSPDLIYTHLTSLSHHFNFEKFINHLSVKLSSVPVIISGLVTQQYKKNPPKGIHLKKSLPEVMEYLSTL